MHKTYPQIYKTDSKGKTRVWYIEQDGDRYRTFDGTLDGKIKHSEWRDALPTNEGRSNYRDGEEQAAFEIEAVYKRKLEKDYHAELSSSPMTSNIFQPMLAGKTTLKDVKFPCLIQPKLDGIRCIVNRQGMWSRSGKPIVSCQHVYNACMELFAHNPEVEFFDGELYNHGYKDDFNTIQSMVMKKSSDTLTFSVVEQIKELVQYHVYDVGFTNISPSFSERERFIRNQAGQYDDYRLKCVFLVKTQHAKTLSDLETIHTSNLLDGYEGSMIRYPDSLYENKRSKSLLKLKEFQDEEFEIVSFDEGKGNWSGTIKSITCRNKNGQLFSAGIKGNRDFTDSLWERRNNPHRVATIRYQNLTPDGIPRFPVAVAFYNEDRDM